MRQLNRPATAVFNRILTMLGDRQALKIDNSNNSFMPLHVDRLYETDRGTVYSLAHYFEQEGDLVCDPDMTFFVKRTGDYIEVFPLTFEMGGRGCTIGAEADADGLRTINGIVQADHAYFANKWLQNIKHQQRLEPLYSEPEKRERREKREMNAAVKAILAMREQRQQQQQQQHA